MRYSNMKILFFIFTSVLPFLASPTLVNSQYISLYKEAEIRLFSN